MRLSTILVVAAGFTAISGHTLFSTLHVGGKNQGDATCIRMPMDGATSTSPIIDLSSNTLACNVDGDTGVARVCPAKQGDKLTFTWRWTANEPELGSIDISHKGPCAVYMKKVDSAIKDPGHGNGWFKVYDFGHDENNKWCTEHLIEAGGLMSINIPQELAGGYYLVRPELLSLHQSYESPQNPSQPQFYTGCAQIFLDSPATGKPNNTVSIPGYVDSSDANMKFNIYTDDSYPYPMHGPPVAKISSTNSRVRVKSRQTNVKQTEGLKPENCVDENGNWCGIELETYNDLDGCLAQGENCWEQLDPCYNGAPPTGFQGCSAWEKKCQEMTDLCNAQNFVGPPNKGKIITPPASGGKVYDLSIAIGMKDVKAVIPDADPDAVPSKAVSFSAAAPSIISSSTVTLANFVTSSAVASPSSDASSASKAATTVKSTYPGSVNAGPAADKMEVDKSNGVELVYMTVTVIANADGTFSTAFPASAEAARSYGTAHAKRQIFQIKPKVVSPPEDPTLFEGSILQGGIAPVEASSTPVTYLPAPEISMAPGPVVYSDPIIPVEPVAPVEPLQPADLPVTRFEFKNDGSNENSISVETRLVVPTTDGSCGQVAGMRCEYDSILVPIAGCCSRFGYCGYSPDHCGTGCQVGYGRCDGVDFKKGKRLHANDGLQTVRHQTQCLANRESVFATATASNPAYVASLPDISQRLRAKELYEKRESKQPSAPILPDVANRLDESLRREKVLSHMHGHGRYRH